MKPKNVTTPKLIRGGYAVAVTLSLCLLFCFSLVRAGAQKAQKRITSVWTATGAEGSRVTVASDTQLNDYEAYTRGDRFYVKIPLASLPSTTGSLLGRGFDDVQIQRVGDGILLSFRLQPGTTARVDHKLNRIEVVFSIPVRSQGSGSGAARNEVASRTRARTIGETDGQTPPMSMNPTGPGFPKRHAERGARTTEDVRSSNSSPVGSAGKRPASESSRQKALREKAVASSLLGASSTPSANQPHASESPNPGKSSESNGSTTKGSTPSASTLPSPSPIFSPSPGASPSSSLAAASASGTPRYVAPITQEPTVTPTRASTGGTSDWASRLHYYKEWLRLNPIPLAVVGLVIVAVLLMLFVKGSRKSRRRDRTANSATPASGSSATTPEGMNPKPSEDPDREVFEL